MDHAHLSMRLLNRPLALLPSFVAAPQRTPAADRSGTLRNIAIIPVCGVLVHGHGDPEWGLLSYDSIRADFYAAMDDPAVNAVVLLVNSPGGHVSGCFELADTIFAARGRKPIVSVLSDCAYSAAYCIAAAADMITVPETGGTGSIGCVVVHIDASEMLTKMGVTATVIRSAARKMEGNEIEPLSDGAKARLQADVDLMAGMFIDRIARYRAGKVTAEQVRAYQAGTFLGMAGVDAGLADVVMPPEEAIVSLIDALQ